MLNSLLAALVSLSSLFNSLDPLSVTEHLAFYELYPDSQEGQKALAHAWALLSGNEISASSPLQLPPFNLDVIIAMITRQSSEPAALIEDEALEAIATLSATLANRKLKGAQVWTKEELLTLPSEEIDLGRALLLYQLEDTKIIRQYEAALDLMALQIRARLPRQASHEDKIHFINRFIFEEMQFRFPPQSVSIQDIDLYTFLPSVLDKRLGVCLGVSILYLALAQRLDLPLEIITPPGHIYVRYRDGEKLINIETTARGIHLPNEQYLGVNTRKLEERMMKEVIGMAFVNQASVYLGKQDYKTTIDLYEKARPFLQEDPLLDLLQGCSYLFVGRTKEGKKLLEKIRHHTFDYAVSAETIPDDYLSGKADIQAIQAVFLSVDATRESIIMKQKELEKILKRYPKFRAGLLQLTTTWLQLGRLAEAQEVLNRYHKLDPKDCTVEYYLAVIAAERLDYNRAWDHLKHAEILTAARNHSPKALTTLRQYLKRICPEPIP